MEIRNIAIIAHVDHGKTTLTDGILRQTGSASEGVSMDSNDLEKERGITIYAKNTSAIYTNTKINILDTPGHADFGSEVERVLRSVDAVLLVVDAAEGPMPQTKFVLKKSLDLGLKPLVVINKIDKTGADVSATEEAVYELFFDLGANEEQLDFKTVLAIGHEGIAKHSLEDESSDLTPLLDLICNQVPAVDTTVRSQNPLSAQVFNLAYDNYLGRMGICRIYDGIVKRGQTVLLITKDGIIARGAVTKLFTFTGVEKTETDEAYAGDIVMVAGLPEIFIGHTIVDNEMTEPLPAITVDEPTLSFNMLVNDSPFAGRVGKYVTSRQIRERLEKELEVNVGMRADFSEDGAMRVYGRGELHLAVLMEHMRREGFEFCVSQPEVIIKEVDGVPSEPFEEVTIRVPEKYTGTVIEKLSARRGSLIDMRSEGVLQRIVFHIPTRGLLGYRGEFIVDTKGEGILTSVFLTFSPHAGEVIKTESGSMVSMATGKALAYALDTIQNRGVLYIRPGDDVYEGMVIGSTSKGEDMVVNPTKGKQLTNVRASGSDSAIQVAPPYELTLENALGAMREDEYLEVTPDDIRLRKQYLTENERKKHVKHGAKI